MAFRRAYLGLVVYAQLRKPSLRTVQPLRGQAIPLLRHPLHVGFGGFHEGLHSLLELGNPPFQLALLDE